MQADDGRQMSQTGRSWPLSSSICAGGTFPVQYLGANVPQAWAAGSVFHLLRALLGLDADAHQKKLTIDPEATVLYLQVGAGVNKHPFKPLLGRDFQIDSQFFDKLDGVIHGITLRVLGRGCYPPDQAGRSGDDCS